MQLLQRLGLYARAKAAKSALARRLPGAVRHRRAAIQFYSQLIQPGELCFDIGAHTGERTRMFLALGARVVAVEPQRACVEQLLREFGQHPRVTVVAKAVGDQEGVAELAVCDEAPEISTLSRKWREEGRFAGQHQWTKAEKVPVTTLDSLIQLFGRPAFCKIDVEGFEPVVLKGLSHALPLLSFEFTYEFMADARNCVDYLLRLGPALVNCTVLDGTDFLLPAWTTFADLSDRLHALSGKDLWGDIYVKAI